MIAFPKKNGNSQRIAVLFFLCYNSRSGAGGTEGFSLFRVTSGARKACLIGESERMKRKTAKELLADSCRELAESKSIDNDMIKDIVENYGGKQYERKRDHP